MYDVKVLYGPAGPVSSTSESQAYGINSSGEVAGIGFPLTMESGIPYPVPNPVGAVWTNGNLKFSLPIKSESFLYSVNDSGDAVGVRAIDNSDTQIAILVRNNNAVVDLSPVVGQGATATHINKTGLICGWGWGNPKAFVYDSKTNTVVSWINPLPGTQHSIANAINSSGDVVGRSDSHAFIFSSGSAKDLGLMPFVTGINDGGVACGSIGKPYPQNYIAGICDTKQPNPSFVPIPSPPGFLGSHGEGINNNGEVVGTCWDQNSFDGQQSAYIYQKGFSTDLNTLIDAPGWHLETAHDINDSGEISGTGTFNGQQVGFLLRPRFFSRRFLLTLPELVATLLGGVDRDGGGWVIIGGHPVPIGPWGPWLQIAPEKRDAFIALAMDEVAMFITNHGARETVRKTLLEVSRSRLEQLLDQAGEGRAFGAPQLTAARTTRRMKNGKYVESLRRFRFSE